VEEKELKVTDKRIFNADGELRDEYRHLETAAPEAPPAQPAPSESAAATVTPPPLGPDPQRTSPPRLEMPDTGSALGGPTFFDLVAMLAEPASMYLGDVALPDGKTAEDLEMARVHIDLLAVLRAKTAGQLDAQELAFLDEILYRLRVRYVQKRG
jgi:hypothetical protein